MNLRDSQTDHLILRGKRPSIGRAYGADTADACAPVDFLLATGVGLVSTEEVLRVLTTVIDVGTEQGFSKILLDFSAVMGELSVVNLYAVGKAMADYCESKSIHPKLAVIGKPPPSPD